MLLISSLYMRAQSIRLEGDVRLIQNSVYASRNSRTDSKGRYCGVLLVHSTIPDLRFSGKVVGDVRYESGVYYVYLSSNASKLEIYDLAGSKLQIRLPKIGMKTTYEVTVYKSNERGSIECSSDPSGATVTLLIGEEKITVGKTPLKGNVEVLEGVYDIEFFKKGYETKILKKIRITPKKATKLGTVKLNNL